MSAPALRPFLAGEVPILAAIFIAAIEALAADDYSEAQREAWTSAADDEEQFGKRLAAELTAANAKGPRFADPLEMWGEALVRENRSDLALAKFADAGKYAPNWGRLHLKWGEALLWLGRKDEAHAQLTLAAGLSLTPAERAELAALRTT